MTFANGNLYTKFVGKFNFDLFRSYITSLLHETQLQCYIIFVNTALMWSKKCAVNRFGLVPGTGFS
jgi:hypothetical protein